MSEQAENEIKPECTHEWEDVKRNPYQSRF